MVARDRVAACQIILGMIPVRASVGCGDSATLRQMGIFDELTGRGTVLVNPQTRELMEGNDNIERVKAIEALRRKAMSCDVFLSSTNAVTMDGRLVNVDGVGNRVAGMFFGPKQVVLVAGRNKIVPNLDVALDRLRHVISPYHVSTKTPRKKTPCNATGKCNDCLSPERTCCITTIIEGKPYLTDIFVLLVDEDLGLGWDPSWPEERIKAIREDYKKHTFTVTVYRY